VSATDLKIGTTTLSSGGSGTFVGNVTGNVTGNVIGNITGNVAGNVTGNLNSSGVSTITTLQAGAIQNTAGTGIPDGVKLIYTANSNGTNRTLTGDSGWVSHMSGTFSPSKISNVLVTATFSMTFESGAVQTVCRLLIDGVDYGGFCCSKQSTANSGASASGTWQLPNVTAGSHTYDLQVRNTQGSTTCILNYWDGGLGGNYGLDTIMFIYQ
jgi:hypothetical protein